MSSKQDPHAVICTECGVQFMISDDSYVKFNKIGKPFVCSSCRSKLQHKRMTPEDYAKRAEKFRNTWNNKSDEEKAQHSKKISNSLHNLPEEKKKEMSAKMSKGQKQRWESYSEEEKAKIITDLRNASDEWNANLTDEEKAELSRKNSEAQKKAWANKSDEQRARDIKQLRTVNDEFRNNITVERRLEIKGKISSALSSYLANMDPNEMKIRMNYLEECFHNWWDTMSLEEYQQECKKRSDYYYSLPMEEKRKYSIRSIEAWERTPEEQKIAVSIRERQRWENKTDEEKEAVAIREREHWENKSPEEKALSMKLINEGAATWRENLTDAERKEHSEKLSNSLKLHWENMTDEERIIASSKMKAPQRRSSLALKFGEFLKQNLSEDMFQEEYSTSIDKNTHSWDFAIFKNGQLDCLVDLDGEYFHADKGDYDGMRSHIKYDIRRFKSIPNGVKWCIIQEKKFDECMKWFLKILGMDYNAFIQETVKYFKAMSFPQPYYDNELLKYSMHKLTTFKPFFNYCDDIGIDNRFGDIISTHFHYSMIGHLEKAWHDDAWLTSQLNDHMIGNNHLNPNKILQSFLPDFVSGGKAKMIIHQYLSKYGIIFNPNDGYSGILLGTIASDKKYVYNPLSSSNIEETRRLVEYFKLTNVQESTEQKFPCMFTEVNSYKEINDFIDHYDCEEYIFIISDPGPYEEFIVGSFNNSYIIKM